MTFQSSVAARMGFGIVGEFFLDSARRVQPALLDSADAANNVFGRAFTVKAGADGLPGSVLTAEAGSSDGLGVFAGILVNPKAHASYGTAAGGPLAASLTLPNDVVAELCNDTAGVIVDFGATGANVGDWVEYDNGDGVLAPKAPGSAATAGATLIPGARVERYDSASGLAVVSLSANATPYATAG